MLHKAGLFRPSLSRGVNINKYELLVGRGGLVVKALRYKPAGRGFDSRWYHWNFSVT